jgi:DNA-directed RNA polymerase subunit A"
MASRTAKGKNKSEQNKEKRNLTKTEINDILEFVNPNPRIPSVVAEEIVSSIKKDMRQQLQKIMIYPELIPKLQENMRRVYISSLVQPGECVGIIMAQSIGEKQTQANLNSVDWKEQVLYMQGTECKTEPIGKMIDELLTCNLQQFFPESHTEYLEVGDKNIFIPSADENGRCGWYRIEAVTRHYPKGKLVKVTTQSGRTVTATQDKSFVTWNGEKFTVTLGSDIVIGDILPTTIILPPFKDTINHFDMRTVFSPQEYVYTTEIVKARTCRDCEWTVKNGKDFTLPYNRRDVCFGRRKDFFMTCQPGFVYIQKSNKFISNIPDSILLDNNFGFFVGIYLAEGWVTKTFLGISNNDASIRKRVTDFCHQYGITYHLVTSKGKNVRNGTSNDLKLHSVLLARLFKNVCDTGSSNKKVPAFAYTAPKEFMRGLLDGYFSGDGTINKNNGHVIVTSASIDLITGIAFLLTHFGIFSKIGKVQPKTNNVGSKNMKISHVLTIANIYARLFAEKISLTEYSKQERLSSITLKKSYMFPRGKNQEKFPERDVYFDPVVSVEYVDGTTEYVYDFTVESTRYFQLWNGITVNDTFHRAGSADKQPVVSKFSELLNATNKPKAPSFLVYFTNGNDTVPKLRETIGHSIVQLSFKKITKNFTICVDKEEEPWYPAFNTLYGDMRNGYTDCISLEINMDILFEYKLTLQEIADYISREYSDLHCVYSPDCFGQLDIFVDTQTIDLPEEKLIFVTQDNAREIYLEEVVQPTLENIVLCGIPGIMNMFFVKDEDKKWIIETENSREKIVESTKFKNTKVKPADSIKRFKKVLAHPEVDMSRTLSNNVWDIYHTLGIEAVRQYMIDEFSKIMEGINMCHVMLLVDKMTNGGSIASISRYTMRREDTGVLGKSSFEETLDNLLGAGIYGQDEPTQGVSASIICGKRARIGTGLCDIAIDLKKLMTVPECDEESEVEDE